MTINNYPRFSHSAIAFLLSLMMVVLIEPAWAQEKQAQEFDNGKMWTFEYPPTDYFIDTYQFTPDDEWFDKARLGALRIPSCSASFVSSFGLVLTNHHCARQAVTSVTNEGEMLTENGFYASSLESERQIPGYYADQLIDIDDVTQEIIDAEQNAQTDAELTQARNDAIEAVKQRLTEEAGDENVVVEVIPLYHGGRYSAYTFKRFTDVRLVFTPELKMGYYGGDADNFTFPRYSFDMTLLRVYEDGEPYEPEHFFLLSLEGVQVGDPVFVIGNPGSTSRLETVAQLEQRRDMREKNLLAFLNSHISALEDFQAQNPAEKNKVRDALFSLANAKKAYTGQLKALNDPILMARRQDAETKFRNAIGKDTDLREKYGEVHNAMADVQKQILEQNAPDGAFFALTSSRFSAAILRRAMLAHTLLDSQEKGLADSVLTKLEADIAAIPDTPDKLDAALLTARLGDIQTSYGKDHALPKEILGGNSPAQKAQEIITGSALASAEKFKAAMAAGTLTALDPALKMVSVIKPAYQDFQSAVAGLYAKQTTLSSEIGRARFAVYDTEIPPDATFSLRIADGEVKGYDYNGTYATPFTSFFGLYDHHHSYGGDSDWGLPEKWATPPAKLDMATPMNFASTNDIIGGNSGSPVVNKDLELVGLIFDGNIESLAGNYIYLPEIMRSVSVDGRGMLEALSVIYKAERIVEELSNDVLISSDDEVGANQ